MEGCSTGFTSDCNNLNPKPIELTRISVGRKGIVGEAVRTVCGISGIGQKRRFLGEKGSSVCRAKTGNLVQYFEASLPTSGANKRPQPTQPRDVGIRAPGDLVCKELQLVEEILPPQGHRMSTLAERRLTISIGRIIQTSEG